MGTLKPQSNSNTAIGTLAVDGWAITFGTARAAWAWAGCSSTQSLLAVPNATAHPSTAGVTNFILFDVAL